MKHTLIVIMNWSGIGECKLSHEQVLVRGAVGTRVFICGLEETLNHLFIDYFRLEGMIDF